jgi:hypothetical protein
MPGRVDALQAAIDGLGALDPHDLSDAELHEAVVAVQRARARLGAVAAGLVGVWDRRRVWASDGSRSPAARLARDTACATTSAGVEVRRARQLAAMPATATALGAGVLSLDHVDLLGRAHQPHRAASFARDEPLLVRECARLRFAQATRAVAYWCRRADTDTGHDGTPPDEPGVLHASTTIDGTVAVTGTLDPIGGATVVNELHRLERQLQTTDRHEGHQRTRAQRLAAALVTMAQRSATTPANGRRPKPLFSVLVGEGTLTELCELANGTVLTPHQLSPWIGTAELETILFDGPSTVVSVSKRRTFTGALRRAIEVRDRHCQHPAGCDIPADDCDVDHIVPHPHGGLTSQFNGRLECTTHNRRADHHDHGARPHPHRDITCLDELRARLHWRNRRDDDGSGDGSHEDDPDGDGHGHGHGETYPPTGTGP